MSDEERDALVDSAAMLNAAIRVVRGAFDLEPDYVPMWVEQVKTNMALVWRSQGAMELPGKTPGVT